MSPNATVFEAREALLDNPGKALAASNWGDSRSDIIDFHPQLTARLFKYEIPEELTIGYQRLRSSPKNKKYRGAYFDEIARLMSLGAEAARPRLERFALYASPESFGLNFDQLLNITKIWLDRMSTLVEGKKSGGIGSSDTNYSEYRREFFSMVSLVLLNAPVWGTDGPPEKRSYHVGSLRALRKTEGIWLRELGYWLDPTRFNIAGIQRACAGLIELYKLEIDVPSDLVGYNLDPCTSWDPSTLENRVTGLKFECFESPTPRLFKKPYLFQSASLMVGLDPAVNSFFNLERFAMVHHNIHSY
ncbi:MAG: hypothetical protein HQM16_16565 [Deltaproteobacteria bacterium]|nr:hypothetical protein [Deltaproteobacteria bacterium]